jgi:hypothetical protein
MNPSNRLVYTQTKIKSIDRFFPEPIASGLAPDIFILLLSSFSLQKNHALI